MSSSLPKLTDYLERVENEHLEVKEARALEDPRNVPRAVCAFLNAKGGDVVIGIRDGGKSLDPIRDPKEAMRSLRDRLVAMISPSIPSGLDIDILDSDHGAGLLVHVPIRPKGTLFALRSSEGRFSFPRRSGDRTLNLDWPDILR